MWPDRYDKHFFHVFPTCHPIIERKMVWGTLLDSLQYYHKVTKTILQLLMLSLARE